MPHTARRLPPPTTGSERRLILAARRGDADRAGPRPRPIRTDDAADRSPPVPARRRTRRPRPRGAHGPDRRDAHLGPRPRRPVQQLRLAVRHPRSPQRRPRRPRRTSTTCSPPPPRSASPTAAPRTATRPATLPARLPGHRPAPPARPHAPAAACASGGDHDPVAKTLAREQLRALIARTRTLSPLERRALMLANNDRPHPRSPPRCTSASEPSTTRSSARATSSANRSPPDAAPTVPGHRIAPRPAATRFHNAIEALVVRVGLGNGRADIEAAAARRIHCTDQSGSGYGSVQPRRSLKRPRSSKCAHRVRRDPTRAQRRCRARSADLATWSRARARQTHSRNEVFAALPRSPRRCGSRQHSRAGRGTGGRLALSAAISLTRSTAPARGRQQPAPVPSVT